MSWIRDILGEKGKRRDRRGLENEPVFREVDISRLCRCMALLYVFFL
jgi:hypothetical protein